MPRTRGQKLKMLELARLLQERTDEEHPLTLSEIIRALDAAGIAAERKSLYSDLEELQNFGLDVIRVKGKQTGYYLGERDFQLPELRLLVDAVQSSRFLTRKKSEELIRKLQRLTSTHQAKSLMREVSVAGRIKTMNESIYITVDELSGAMEDDRMVSFQYFERNSAGERILRRNGRRYRVSPYLLHWDSENYYLVAVDEESGGIRHFRVDKMQNVIREEDARKGQEAVQNLDPAAYEKKLFGMFGGREESVTLRCAEDLAGVFFDRFGDSLVTRRYDGFFETTLHVQISPVFLSWLMTFGERVKILEPESVRQNYIDLARQCLKANGDTE